MTPSTQLPFHHHQREQAGTYLARESVEVALAPDTAELDLRYCDRAGASSTRRIKPVALSVLQNGELSLIATCRLREASRNFAFQRIQQASFPGFPAMSLSGAELLKIFAPDVKRLMAHDATINGLAIRPARPFPEVISQHTIANLEILSADVPPGDVASQKTTLSGVCSDLVSAIDRFLIKAGPETGKIQSGATVTTEMRDGVLRVHVDVSTKLALSIREGSHHARIAFIMAQKPICEAAAALHGLLMQEPHLGHPDMTVRLMVQRSARAKSDGANLAIDNNWINTGANAGSTIATKLRKAINALNQMPEVSPLGLTPAEWLVETTAGTHRIRAARARDAAPRLLALTEAASLQVLAVAQVVDPHEVMHTYP